MSQTFTFTREDLFPIGTDVVLYRISGWPFSSGSTSGPPPGTAVSTATVAGDGYVTFSGLVEDTNYVAYAGSPDRHVTFRTDEDEPGTGGGGGGGGGTVGHTILDENLANLPARAQLQFSGTGVYASDDGVRTVVKVIDEAANPLDERFGGGAATDGTTDSYAALDAALQAAVAADRGRLFIPPYTFRTTQGLVTNSNALIMEGAGARRSRIQLLASVDDDVFRFHAAGGTAFSSQGQISDIAFCTTQGASRSDGNAGLVLDAVQHVDVKRCYAFGNDIGFDMRNNCFGSGFSNCISHAGENKVGLLLRGATPLTGGFVAGSGSDITMDGNWFGGTDAAIWMEPNAGGYHVIGGQLTGGWSYGSPQDGNGSVVLGRGYKPLTTTSSDVVAGATTIPVTASGASFFFSASVVQIGANKVAYTGRTGDVNGGTLTGVSGVTVDIPSGTPIYLRGAVAAVDLFGVSFEGTDKRHAIRSYEIMDGLSLTDCSINSNGSNRIMSVIKATDAKNSAVALRRATARGIFSAAKPLDIQDLSGSWDVSEEAQNTRESVSFNGVGMNFQTQPMIERSALSTRSFARFGDKVRFGGRTLRWNAGVLESNTDSSAATGWAALGGGGAPANQMEIYTRPGTLVAGEVGISRMLFPNGCTLVSVTAGIDGTVPVGGVGVRIDANKNGGSTIFTTQANRPTVAPSTEVSDNEVPDVTAMAAGDYLTFDTDDVGTTTPGSYLSVYVTYLP